MDDKKKTVPPPGDYRDILYEPPFEPKNHPRMMRIKRAAQFAPFAALQGFEEQIGEESLLERETVKREEAEEIP